MLHPAQMFRMLTEVVFVLAGAVLLFVGLSGQYLFNARRPSWLALAVVLFFWGIRQWRHARIVVVPKFKLASQIAGVSLVLVSAIMVSLGWAPLQAVGPLLATAGSIFVARGILTSAILATAK